MAKPLTPKQRRAVLETYAKADAEGDVGTLVTAQRRYLAGLPRPALSRSPFTKELVTHSIDPVDIDGPWWNYNVPVRPVDEPAAGMFALTGALHLEAPPATTAFLVKPGPEAPFVVPRLLRQPSIKAVIFSLRIGPHRGFPVTYFSDTVLPQVPRFNTWGANKYWFHDAEGSWGWNENFEDFETLDFDLRPWVERGKLLWIAEGDSSMRLRESVDDFPYDGVDGRKTFMRIQFGDAWEPERPPADALKAYAASHP